MTERLHPRARQIVDAARDLLEQHGRDALTMRRVADRIGIRAPSLYKHFPDKAAVEIALIADGLGEVATVLEAAEERTKRTGAAESLADLATAYRSYALAHPHLYRLMTERPLPRESLPAGLEDRAAAPLVRATGEEHLARATWAFAHGMVMLELAGRFPADADLDATWRIGVRALLRR